MLTSCIPGRIPCSCNSEHIASVIAAKLLANRLLVDANLSKPARWRGSMLREVVGHSTSDEHERFVFGFNWAVNQAYEHPEEAPSVAALCTLHSHLIGGEELRSKRAIRTDGHFYPHPGFVPRLLEDLFKLHQSRLMVYGPVRAVAELHLDLLTIHPFHSGNGRSVRAIASAELVRAGFRSTLFTAVEQHFLRWRVQYIQMLNLYLCGRVCRSACILSLVLAMVFRIHYAKMHSSKNPRTDDIELGDLLSGANTPTLQFVVDLIASLDSKKTATESWLEFRSRVADRDKLEFDDQVERLRSEEED